MPEVVRGSRASFQVDRGPTTPTSPAHDGRHAHFGPESPALENVPSNQLTPVDSGLSGHRKSSQSRREHRHDEEERDAYYDSRAATKREFRRRASTLQEYYEQHPTLLPQLPFTWRHGWKRWRLFFIITVMFVDACLLPIILYYALRYGGHVPGWIIFAVLTTIWGGPTYVEFAVRCLRLMKKENFYRPLGTSKRYVFDITHWMFVLTIAAVTALFIVGSAPHTVWLRVLSMPGPAILYSMGGPLFLLTIWNLTGRKAPFRISSTEKGQEVKPGVYYIIEDIISVNANAGRPYREALAARYTVSPRFRRMIRTQSIFWSVPALVLAIACTVVICIHEVPKNAAYAIGWAVPFGWAGIWAAITVPWVRRDMRVERETWELDSGISPSKHQDRDKEKEEQEREQEKLPEPEP